MTQRELSERFMLASRGEAGSEWVCRTDGATDSLIHSSGDTWTRTERDAKWKRVAEPMKHG